MRVAQPAPGADQATGEQVDDDRPMRSDVAEGTVAARKGKADVTTTRLIT
jgi:hypothetical protein